MIGRPPRSTLFPSTPLFRSVRLRPQDATANNALGASLLAAGRIGEALPYLNAALRAQPDNFDAHYNLARDRKSTRLNSSHSQISYAVFCLKKKKNLL